MAATFRNSYADRSYNCRCCGQAAVFTALEQKHAFEVNKTHIHKQRFLCEPCWRAEHAVQEKLAAMAARWAQNQRELRGDLDFLGGWRALLSEHERYGARPDQARQAMLDKLIQALGAPGQA